jgi:NADH dehydrogenase [ubiquinone] 1 alpha subcomplex assembly factor 5
MAEAMEVFDRRLVRRRRARAAPGFAAFDFVVREVAARLADRLADIDRRFQRALDIGCHRGEVADALGERGFAGTLVQCDLAPEMAAAASGGPGRLRLAADEEALPFRAESFDLALSAFSLHWVNDLPGTLIQIARLLGPDGLMLAAIPGGGTLSELRAALAQAELAEEGGTSPRVSPFVDIRDAGALLQRAGFALPVIDAETLMVEYRDPWRLLADLRGMGEGNALLKRRRAPLRRATLAHALDILRTRHAGADGRVRITVEILTLTGWKAHPGQPKPLKRGSAAARLADALARERGGSRGE